MISRRPARLHVVVAALMLLVVLVGALGVSEVMSDRSSSQSTILSGEKTDAHLAASALGSALASRLELVNNLASQPSVATYLTKATPKELTTLVATLHLLYPGFSSFDIVARNGRLEARWPNAAALVGKDLSSANFYTGVMAKRAPYVSEVLRQTSAPHEFVVGLAAPIRNASGAIAGVLQATLQAKTLGSVIGGTTFPGGGVIELIDQGGHVVAGLGSGSVRSFSALTFIRASLAGRSGSGIGSVPGLASDRLAGYAPVTSTGWAVIAENPTSLINTSLGGLTERLGAIGLIVVLLALGAALSIGLLIRRLTREHEHSGAVLASVGEGVATLDSSGRLLEMNPALEQLIGRSTTELRGRAWHEVAILRDAHGEIVPFEDSVAGKAVRERRVIATSGYGLYVATPDGPPLPVAATAAPLLVEDKLEGAVLVLRDVSREQEVDELKSSLVSTVSHELRTPLTMIQGFAELLCTRDDLDPSRTKDALSRIHASAQRLGRLIDDLLSVSRIDSGKLVAEIAPVELAEIVTEALAAFQAQNGSRLRVDIDPDLGPVLADRDKGVQVVTNLVSNAIKYSEPGSPVRVLGRRVDDHAVISVVDEGIGLSAPEIQMIFEKFVRSNRPDVRKVGGTGLGLYISKNLVELQRGRLWVESKPGKGSTFSFSLPIAMTGTGPVDNAYGISAQEGRQLAQALDR